MIINEKLGFIFFCNGRTGTTSIEAALMSIEGSYEFNYVIKGLWTGKHIPPAVAMSLIPEKQWRSSVKFVFVRNPYDWFVSQVKHNARKNWIKRRKIISNPKEFATDYFTAKRLTRLSQSDTFSVEEVSFIHNRLKAFRVFPSATTLSQTSYVNDINGERIVDKVGRFENIDADFKSIMEPLGAEILLPHKNSTTRSEYQTYFTPQSRKEFEQLWKQDLVEFGYEF